MASQSSPASTSPTATDTASAVLTNRSLFTLTVSFLDGLPGFAIAFARRHATVGARYWRATGQLPALAIAVDDDVMLERLYRLYEQQRLLPDARLSFCDAMTYAAEQGKLRALQWLHDHTTGRCDPKTLAFAATMGRFEVVQWLAANRIDDACASLTTSPCDAMVLTGHLALVQFLTTQFPALCLTSDAMDYAAAHGFFDIVRYLHETRTEGCSTAAMDHAARCGRLDLVRFLHEERQEGCTSDALDMAAANGHVDVVTFLHEHRTEGGTVQAMDEAARNGHLDVVAYLHTHRTEGCTTFAMDMAAACGHLAIVQFLYEQRHEGCSPLAMIAAAEAGHVSVVALLHAADTHEANCSSEALYAAARNGHTEVVEYLIQHCIKGCLVLAHDVAESAGCPKTAARLRDATRDGVSTCTDRSHSWGTRRPCQREHVAAQGLKTEAAATAW